MPATDAPTRCLAPGWFTRRVFNRGIARLTRLGLSLVGSRVLEVRGRSSGVLRSNIVNLLEVDGQRYLVAPRGHTEWVRNLRAAGAGTLRVGRRIEAFSPEELTDAVKPPILRAYLRRWKSPSGVEHLGC